ncbi:hypothetical protein BAGQ_3422 [Bacillus velezensis]|nr:hypothetical protein BCBMB205_32820 [Bacillus velezensis]ARZ59627.1 hypothetical protein BAGQ_3422 [Bacillus velezensis]
MSSFFRFIYKTEGLHGIVEAFRNFCLNNIYKVLITPY